MLFTWQLFCVLAHSEYWQPLARVPHWLMSLGDIQYITKCFPEGYDIPAFSNPTFSTFLFLPDFQCDIPVLFCSIFSLSHLKHRNIIRTSFLEEGKKFPQITPSDIRWCFIFNKPWGKLPLLNFALCPPTFTTQWKINTRVKSVSKNENDMHKLLFIQVLWFCLLILIETLSFD